MSTFKQAEEIYLVLVTGATGFLATHVIKTLLEHNYRVRGTVRDLQSPKVEKLRSLFGATIELVETDLLEDSNDEQRRTWTNAVAGCRYVMHTASPSVPLRSMPSADDENQLIRPAFKGTLNVLRACLECHVERVVLTSSCCSMFGDKFEDNRVYTEHDWPYFRRLKPFAKSKVVAERAAWEFVKERRDKNLQCFELAVVNPGFIFASKYLSMVNFKKIYAKGPILYESETASTHLITCLMLGKIWLLPEYSFPACDVRNVAEAHLKAMILPEAKNMRHIVVSRRDCLSFLELAWTLENEFKSRNYDISSRMAPNFAVRLYSIVDKIAKQLSLNLGKQAFFDNTRMVETLKVKPIELHESIYDMAYSLIRFNLIPKKFI